MRKFILDIDEKDADIVVERPASIEDHKVSQLRKYLSWL
jgi:hypothetical protein